MKPSIWMDILGARTLEHIVKRRGNLMSSREVNTILNQKKKDAYASQRQSALITCILDEDCLQELFSRCSTADLLVLQRTCKLFHSLLAGSQLVWARRLWKEFGLNVDINSPVATPLHLKSLLKQAHSGKHEDLRFRGTLVNGSVDELNMTYWCDNMFRSDSSPYCSGCSVDADCLALLFDGENPESQRVYDEARVYMRSRCRYAAAFLERLRNPQVRDVRDMLDLVERWGDQHLEHFFLEMTGLLLNEHPLGQMLLYDLPNRNVVGEIARLQATATYIRRRPELLLEGMVQLPGPLKTIFDASTMEKLRPAEGHSCVGVLHRLQLSRAGSLTCPVAAGVVLAGVVDYAQLQNKCEQEIAEALQTASQQPVCLSFNSLQAVDVVEDHAGRGLIPPILSKSVTHAGTICEFDTSRDAVDYVSAQRGDRGKLIAWMPLVWFKFHSREEALQVQVEVAGPASDQGGNALMERTQEENVEVANASTQNDQEQSSMPGTDNGTALSEELSPSLDEDGSEDIGSEDTDEDFIDAIEEADEEDLVFEEDDFPVPDRTAGRNILAITLSRPIVANALMVKLINQENLMNELNDPHTWPNIDMQSVMVTGQKLHLPLGLQIKPF